MVALFGGLTAILLADRGTGPGQSGTTETGVATAAVATTPAPKPRRVRVALKGSTAYDPEGDGAENNADVGLATDGSPATAWKTERYHGSFTKSGVGLVLDAGHPVRVTRMIVATDSPGSTAEVRVGASPQGPFASVSRAMVMTRKTTFSLHPRSGRYLMLWITAIPTPGAASVNEVSATSGG
jgi:putative peptidoglycan lipid II flippase